jgi:hypothetical protein
MFATRTNANRNAVKVVGDAWRVSISPAVVRRSGRGGDCLSTPSDTDRFFRRNAMRVMVIIKATPESEAGQMPSMELIAAMGKFNEELVNAGIMQSGDGLKPSSQGVRVKFSGKDRTVVDGPFAETKELIAGFWIWQVQSMDEAIEWVRRCPNPMTSESDVEIRPFFEAADFGDAFTPELQEQEERLRQQIDAQNR